MNEVERKRFLDTLRRDDDFRATVRRELLTEELLNLPQTVATLVDVVAHQRHDFSAVATDVRDYMERTITLIGEGFTATRADSAELRADMGAGFAAVAARFDDMGAGFAAVAAVEAELRADMGAGFAAVDARFDQVNAEIRGIKADVRGIKADVRGIKDRLAS